MDSEDRKIIGGLGYVASSVSIGTGVAIIYGEGYGLITFGSMVMVASVALIWHVVTEGC